MRAWDGTLLISASTAAVLALGTSILFSRMRCKLRMRIERLFSLLLGMPKKRHCPSSGRVVSEERTVTGHILLKRGISSGCFQPISPRSCTNRFSGLVAVRSTSGPAVQHTDMKASPCTINIAVRTQRWNSLFLLPLRGVTAGYRLADLCDLVARQVA
jgi:hypothetical protein